jgi:hypothetical protein
MYSEMIACLAAKYLKADIETFLKRAGPRKARKPCMCTVILWPRAFTAGSRSNRVPKRTSAIQKLTRSKLAKTFHTIVPSLDAIKVVVHVSEC